MKKLYEWIIPDFDMRVDDGVFGWRWTSGYAVLNRDWLRRLNAE